MSNLNKTDLRQDREFAEPAHRMQASVSVSGLHRDEAQLAGEIRNVSLLVASAVNSEELSRDSWYLRECQGIQIRCRIPTASVDRGLKSVQLIISDACRGLIESVAEYLPGARHA